MKPPKGAIQFRIGQPLPEFDPDNHAVFRHETVKSKSIKNQVKMTFFKQFLFFPNFSSIASFPQVFWQEQMHFFEKGKKQRVLELAWGL